MAAMGYGYGSECHLLRWMGRHRRAFDEAVCAVLNKVDGPINWLDLRFDAGKPWPDRELTGLEFIADSVVRGEWRKWWPTSGNSQNWDAVGWWGDPVEKRIILVEAKAHLEEIHSKCQADPECGLARIKKSLQETADNLEVADITRWLEPHYQLANRLAVLHFLHSRGYLPELLLIYFVGDRQFPARQVPETVEKWAQPIVEQKTEMGLPADHDLLQSIHELFLHVAQPLAWSRANSAAQIVLSNAARVGSAVG